MDPEVTPKEEVVSQEVAPDEPTETLVSAPSSDLEKLLKENESLKRRASQLQGELGEYKEADKLRSLEDRKRAEDFEGAEKIYQETINKLQDQIKSEKLEAVRTMAKAALITKGLSPEYVDDDLMVAAIDRYAASEERAAPEEYAASMAERYPGLFVKPSGSGLGLGSSAAPPSVHTGTTDWEKVKQMEQSDDPKARIEARKLISEYRKKHGEYPYKL